MDMINALMPLGSVFMAVTCKVDKTIIHYDLLFFYIFSVLGIILGHC